MPVLFAAVPAAALLAWLAMRFGGPKRSSSSRVPMGAGLEGGDTGQLRGPRPHEDDPWKRDELPFASGGEVGGPYGPASNAEPVGMGSNAPPPGPTQTTIMAGGPPVQYAHTQAAKAALAATYGPPRTEPAYQAPAAPAPVFHPPPAAPAPVYHGGSVPRPAAAPSAPPGRYE